MDKISTRNLNSSHIFTNLLILSKLQLQFCNLYIIYKATALYTP